MNRIAVFCGSNMGVIPEYAAATERLAQVCVRQGGLFLLSLAGRAVVSPSLSCRTVRSALRAKRQPEARTVSAPGHRPSCRCVARERQIAFVLAATAP